MRLDRIWPCGVCGRQMTLDCNHGFPLFTPLGGMRMLAASLLEHYEINSDEHPAVVAELADILGEEMLSVGREILTERGLLADPAMAAAR